METSGCDLLTAAFELPEPNQPARLVVEAFKPEKRDKLVTLCREAGERRRRIRQTCCWKERG